MPIVLCDLTKLFFFFEAKLNTQQHQQVRTRVHSNQVTLQFAKKTPIWLPTCIHTHYNIIPSTDDEPGSGTVQYNESFCMLG